MLTRLKVSGFKNLVDVDVRFGPFTCIAGANGVGKSNLFDAIRFLSALADWPLMDAAKSVREGRAADVRNLFHRVSNHFDNQMSFEAEMIIPKTGTDSLGQEAEASITFVRYSLVIGLREHPERLTQSDLEIRKEELTQINLGDAPKHLEFPHKREWRESVIVGRRTSPFISTDNSGDQKIIKLHQDRGNKSEGSGGRTAMFRPATLLRTILQAANAGENNTAVLTRNEMRSWRQLQLEPSAMRRPDDFSATPRLETDGSHMAATLYRLAQSALTVEGEPDAEGIYTKVTNRLSELLEDVQDVFIDRDEQREILNLMVRSKNGTTHSARSLSDGTLRLLALAILELDTEASGVLCLEEPENGIHPARIPVVLKLLQVLAVDPNAKADAENPLRQIIINTHSPSVVANVPDGSLIVATSQEIVDEDGRSNIAAFKFLPDTWRARASTKENEADQENIVARGKLLHYLNPLLSAKNGSEEPKYGSNGHHEPVKDKTIRPRRVMDRPDLQMLLPYDESAV